MSTVNELRSRTVDLLQSSSALLKENGLLEKEKKLDFFINRLKKGRTVVVVCGEFKRGKSSFINALIEEPGLCPVDIDITTNMATQVIYSNREYVRIHYRKETGKSPVLVQKADISKYVTEQSNKENREAVQLVEIGSSKQILNKNLMVIVDTPGVGSLNAKHSEVTASYLSVADVLLFVCDATAPLTTAELDFVKRASKYCNNIYFILTKIDMVRDWKKVEEENRKKIGQCLEKEENSIKIFPVSSLNKLDYIKTGDEESLEDSRFKVLEDSLQKELGSSIAKNMLLTPLVLIKNHVSDIKKSLSMQYQTFQQGTVEKKKAVEEKLVEINEQYKALQKSNSKWQLMFSDSSMDIKRKMRKVINDGFLNLEKDLKEKVKLEAFRSNPETVNSFIKNNVFDTMKDADDLLNEEVNELQERIADLLGREIDINLIDLSDLDITGVDNKVFEDQRDSGEKLRDLGRNVSLNAGAFTAIGALAGGAVFGIIGTFLGMGISAASWGYKTGGLLCGVLGGVFGAKNHSKELNKKHEMEMLKACMEVLRENKANCLEMADAELTQLLSQIKNSFYSSIQESMEAVEKTKNEINKNLGLNSAEINAQSQKLQASIKSISDLESKIGSTIAEVQSL